MIGGPSSHDAFAPIANPQSERIAALAARIGREVADCAALIFPLPLAPDVRQNFEAETVAAIADQLGEFGELPAEDRQRFTDIARLALDRRLAYHATQLPGTA